MKIAIIDYGMGNLRSVENAFRALGYEAVVTQSPGDLRTADKIVLPGVGAFGDAMARLNGGGWTEVLHEEVRHRGKPFLGICLGMQVLATTGTEHGTCLGLNWIAGEVTRLPGEKANIRIPHIGWNDVRFVKESRLYRGLGTESTFYFVHSYALIPGDAGVISGVCDYGYEFAASLEKDNIQAIQFHPEKSHKSGLAVLKNFALGG